MQVVEIIKERTYKAGYVVRDEKWLTHFEDKPEGHTKLMKGMAYTLIGDYIGNSIWAHRLIVRKGIAPEKKDSSDSVCSIGFNAEEQKWYGWSHRAIYGFGIGSICRKGDCSYRPKNKEDFIESCVLFWDDENHVGTSGYETTNDGVLGVQVIWGYDKKVKNKNLHGTTGGVFTEYPASWGKGEWKALTIEDAKQMAIDFAEGVS